MGISAIENARVRITEDEMEAYLSLPPLEEGESYSMNQVIAFIRSQKVVACIDEETVRRMIDTPVYGHEVCIAKGKRVVNGLDGTLTYQFNTDINTRPEIREDGSVDYWSIHAVELVNAGQVIAVYTDPTEYDTAIFRCRLFPWLGEYSFSLFLGHGYWSHVLPDYMPASFSYPLRICIYVAISLLTGLFIMYFSKALKLHWKKKGTSIRHLFIAS